MPGRTEGETAETAEATGTAAPRTTSATMDGMAAITPRRISSTATGIPAIHDGAMAITATAVISTLPGNGTRGARTRPPIVTGFLFIAAWP